MRRMMNNKFSLLCLLAVFMAGCASVPKSHIVTDGEVEAYRARALKALASPKDWSKESVLLQFKKREVDLSRKLWYDFTPVVVTVWVPTIEPDRRNSFVCFEIDRSSRELSRISLGNISH